MATGWAREGAVQEQIDATIADALKRAQQQKNAGPSLEFCEECGDDIPQGRRVAIPGVRHCVACQEKLDKSATAFAGYNRRGSKDSQLR